MGACSATPQGNDTQQDVPQGSKVGEPAPRVKLLNLERKTVKLTDFRGSETLVLVWNPRCGFCEQMLPDLKESEDNPPEGAPKLVVVSAGTRAENKEMGLRSTVVLDQEFAVGRDFRRERHPFGGAGRREW